MRMHGLMGIWICVLGGIAVAQDGGAGVESQDRAFLIEGVKEIAAPGAPGSLAVFGSTASAVVTGGADGHSEVAVVASGRLGKGRIVAFGHDGFFSADQAAVGETGRLLVNAARWAAAGKRDLSIGLIDGHGLQPLFEQAGMRAGQVSRDGDFQGVDVLVLTPYRLTPQQGNRLRAFARAGGGLLVAATGWGWQSGSKKPMNEFHGNQLLAGSGLGWTDGFAGKTGERGFRVGGAISPGVNAVSALGLLKGEGKPTARDLACAMESIRLALQVTPAADSSYRAEIRKVLAGLGSSDSVVSREKPARVDEPARRLAVGLEAVLAQQSPVEELTASPSASAFPGAVPAEAPRVSHKVTIDTAIPGWHSLGLYAAPGEKISVSVPKGATSLNLAVQIGCHTDQLWHHDSWERVPQIVRRYPITRTTTTASNAYGGLIYVDVPERTARGRFEVTIKNAVEAPLYQLGETKAEEWRDTQRNRPAPWAEMAGKNIIFTVPSSAVRALEDPKSLMMLWDELVAAQDSFAASAPRRRPERFVSDVQISAGYMHSGYPIMGPIDDSVAVSMDEARLRKEGTWGHLHEIGHNHQSGDWTFGGTGEVTNNLLVLQNFDKVLGLRFDRGHPAIQDRAERNKRIHEAWAKGSAYETWGSDPFLGLMMYIQVYEAFGPGPFGEVFAEYARLPADERPKTDDDKRDQWLVRLSRHTGKNLGPFFKAWGVPTRSEAQAAVAELPAWMPEGFESGK